VNRGSVYWINLEPSTPPELGKVRPAAIISNSTYNGRLDSLIVVPLSTKAPEIWPLRVEVSLRGAKRSYAVVPGIRQVSKSRLHERIGDLTEGDMARLDAALGIYLGS